MSSDNSLFLSGLTGRQDDHLLHTLHRLFHLGRVFKGVGVVRGGGGGVVLFGIVWSNIRLKSYNLT